jgi:hypothetical protein
MNVPPWPELAGAPWNGFPKEETMNALRRMPTWLLVGLATVCLGLFGLWQTRSGLALALDAELLAATGGTVSCTKAELDGELCKFSNSQCVGSTWYQYTGVVKITTLSGSPKAKFTYSTEQVCADYYSCASGCPYGLMGGCSYVSWASKVTGLDAQPAYCD